MTQPVARLYIQRQKDVMRDARFSPDPVSHDQVGHAPISDGQTDHTPPIPKRRVRVLVADSSPIHTELLAGALRRDSQLDVLSFDSSSHALPAAVVECRVDVLVISSDVDDEPSRGFEILQQLRALRPETRTVVLANLSKHETILNAFRAGARGVFSKGEAVDLLSKCIHCVHQGQIWANSSQMVIAMEALANTPAFRAVNADGVNLLSKRELEVVRCLAEGLTNREIAERLALSQHTVKNYLFRVFDKLGVSSRVELLYMTLSQTAPGPAAKSGWPRAIEQGHASPGHSPDEMIMLQRAAEAGLPAAQLALAQMYLARRSEPDDVVRAYMWYLVAMERAAQAQGLITKVLTGEQIAQARREAGVWLTRLARSSATALERKSTARLSISARDAES
ncbi:MAG: LuxR C-terminal-related transcriptional regulator [Candidatus Sulfotelmatobacter sp.]